MTARQAAQQGLGRLINNFRVERVYNLCLTIQSHPHATLTQAQMHSIAKRRRQQARAELPKSSTACFHLSTPVLIWETEGPLWIPIYKAAKGVMVIQSLPSGKLEDLTGAVMTEIETVCTFGCSKDGIDIVCR